MFRLNRTLPLATERRGVVSNRSGLRGWWALLLAAALAGAGTTGWSDDLGAELQDFALRTWGKADGLPDASVTALEQTQDGYLWVGTAAGLARFDGIKFTTITLPAEKPNRPA